MKTNALRLLLVILVMKFSFADGLDTTTLNDAAEITETSEIATNDGSALETTESDTSGTSTYTYPNGTSGSTDEVTDESTELDTESSTSLEY